MSTTTQPVTGGQGASKTTQMPAADAVDPKARAAAEAASKAALAQRFGGGGGASPAPAAAKKPTGAAAHKGKQAKVPAPAATPFAGAVLTTALEVKTPQGAGLVPGSVGRAATSQGVSNPRVDSQYGSLDPVVLKVATEIYAAAVGTNVNYANGMVQPSLAIGALRHAKNLLDAMKRFPELSSLDPR